MSTPEISDPPSTKGLQRTLGLRYVSIAGIGIILGAGIYVLIGEAASEAGSLAWVSFLIAAAVTALTGLSYSELSSMFPSAGAGFEYARQAFGMRVAIVTGWLTVTAEIIAASAVALGFGSYLHELVDVDPGIGAVILLGIGTLIAGSGALGSIRIAAVLTLVEVGGLLFVSAVGLVDFDGARVVGGSGAGAVLSGSALVFFAYIGFEDIATFSEEARQPERTIPRAILIAIIVSTAMYVLVALAAIGALGAGALADSGAPLADVVEAVLGGIAGDILAVVALAATGNTALLLLMASCRRIYGMASVGALPRPLARVSGGSGVPIMGLIMVGAIAALFTLWGDLGAIANVTNFALFVAFILVNAALIELRRRSPDAARPFRSPGTLPRRLVGERLAWIPLLPVIGIAATVVLIANLDTDSLLGGLALLAIGIALALLHRRWSKPADPNSPASVSP